MIEALFYQQQKGGAVSCLLCPHHCQIPEDKTGICGVRINQKGKLYSLVWGKPVSTGIDPIEKKPLYHFHPGSRSYSIATVGCNLRCRHCQNADISQAPSRGPGVVGREVSPEKIVEEAVETGCLSISYTYTEPTIFYEYTLDISRLARDRGLKNVFVTNGFIEKEPLRRIAPLLDGANIDLKSFSDEFYRKICGARLSPVLEAITLYRELGVWIEITTLVIPGLNDSEEELRSIARFVKGLGEEVPWHVSRFYPTYRMTDRPATPLEKIQEAWEIGYEEGLRYVYQGNVPAGTGEQTRCPHCREVVIDRRGYRLAGFQLADGRCSFCGQAVDGVGL